eukprot:Nitzschia sp. Nitz4//scaffold187_size43274//33491//33831//NITZ4_007339-RA/size43274-snap-gene-0.65-mRNA-1//-1//CDS//3329539825//8008//frame0
MRESLEKPARGSMSLDVFCVVGDFTALVISFSYSTWVCDIMSRITMLHGIRITRVVGVIWFRGGDLGDCRFDNVNFKFLW